ncbi:MAG: SpoIIE family protein phosphatase [Actinomycetota bacterium]|nr:SpoIIE family protein phosphatase [Actinomycetota bacterium]
MTSRTIDTLPPTGRSASQARRLVAHAVREASLDVLVDEALLLVTELVTNAVVHAGTDVEVHTEVEGARLRVEVVDHSPGSLPIIAPGPAELREGGRGVFLLDALSTEWGTRHFATGKSVWFVLGPDVPRTQGRLPGEAGPLRRDLGWLVGLPADLEQQISSAQLIGELLLRLTEALDLPGGWLVAEAADDEHRWEVIATNDPTLELPEVDLVRRAAVVNRDAALPGPTGGLILPLRARSRVFGALVLHGTQDLSAEDVAVARLVGDRIGVVLRDDRSQASQLRSRGSLALLAEASEMFAGTLDVQLALTLAAQLVVPRFAAWAAVLTAYEHAPRLMAVAHADERRLAMVHSSLSGDTGRQLATRLAEGLVEERPLLVPLGDLPPDLGEDRSGEVLAVPLLARRRLLGLLLVGRPTTGSYGREDVSLLTDLARRAALAVDNARLYEERTAIAQALQASLLPPTLPEADGLEFGARYAAAGEGNEVGGDFYDVFTLPDGGWGLAIGDVCGKGAEAAAITRMARDVLRLLTRDGSPPTEALHRLNEVILELADRGRFCTTTVGTVQRRETGLSVCLANAGHPPPVLLRSDGEAAFVGRAGTVLGVLGDIDVAEEVVDLSPGDALVFYTDGVTERRSGSDMFGDDRLLDCVRRGGGLTADRLAGALQQQVMTFGTGATRDDLAVLVVRCPSRR